MRHADHTSAPAGTLVCEFTIGEQQMQITATVATRGETARVPTSGFGWRVLQALVDTVETAYGDRTSIVITKQRSSP
jgi:hypothetical protein